MARVEIKTLAWGQVVDPYGNGQGGLTVLIRTLAAAPATVYAASTGGATVATVTDQRGRIPGWLDEDSYDVTVSGETVRVEVVGGHSVALGVAGVIQRDAVDPNGTITLDNSTYGTTPPRKRPAINWLADGVWKWQTGFDVGGTSPTDDDLVLAYHRHIPDLTKSRDVIYLTNEEVPRVGIEQNFPVANLDVSAAAYGRMPLRVSVPTPHSTLLDGAQNANLATLNVDSTAGFATSGTVLVGPYPVPYTGKTSTQFTGCSGSFNAIVSDNTPVVDATWLFRGDGSNGAVPVVGISHDGRLALGFASRLPLGLLELDSGTDSSKGIWFGGDTVIYRTSAGALKVDGVSPDAGDVEVTGQVTGNSFGGRGLQKASMTTGSMIAGAIANITLTWGTAFSDTTYAALASVIETTDEKNLIVRKVLSKATGSCVVQVENGGSSTRTGTVMAIGMA